MLFSRLDGWGGRLGSQMKHFLIFILSTTIPHRKQGTQELFHDSSHPSSGGVNHPKNFGGEIDQQGT